MKMNKEEKKELIQVLLENQKTMINKKMVDDIKPFSWMDDNVKSFLSTKLSEQEMNDLDKCARTNLAGQKIMSQSIKQGLEIKRKFRWTFEGKDVDGNVVFPECFVRLDKRPIYPYETSTCGKVILIDGDISVTQFFTFYEEVGQAKKEFEQFNKASSSISMAKLKLFDGLGYLMEEWTFGGVQMKLDPSSEFSEEYIAATWLVSYTNLSWHSDCVFKKETK